MKLLTNLRIFLTIVLITILSNPSFADDDAVVLMPGDQVPFPGILFHKDQAQELKKTILERDAFKLLNDSLTQSLSLKDANLTQISTKNDLLLKENDNLAINLNKERTANQWVYFGYFLLGVAGTVGAGVGLKKLSQ